MEITGKGFFKRVRLYPYRGSMYLSVNQTDEDALRCMQEYHLSKEQFEKSFGHWKNGENVGATTLQSESGNAFLRIRWIQDLNDHGLIAHEALHVISCILSSRGLPLCDESEEAWAYLLAHVVDEIYAAADEFKKLRKEKTSSAK